MIVQDLLLDSNFDLQIKNGDFVIGNSNLQHQQLLLLAVKGDYKHAPLIGVDATSQLLNHNSTLHRDTRIEFVKDGMQVNEIKWYNGKLEIDANY